MNRQSKIDSSGWRQSKPAAASKSNCIPCPPADIECGSVWGKPSDVSNAMKVDDLDGERNINIKDCLMEFQPTTLYETKLSRSWGIKRREGRPKQEVIGTEMNKFRYFH